MILNKKYLSILVLAILFMFQNPILAFGTFAEGYAIVKITQFESRGIIIDSYEGTLETASFNPEDKCDESKDECFSQVIKKMNFSVRPENAEVVNFLNKNLNQSVLVRYRVHRITSISLSSDFEIEEIAKSEAPPVDQLVVSKSGGKRNFSVQGKILQLDYQGTFIGTYEGLYLDEQRGKVHPFSITSQDMALHAYQVMKTNQSVYLGISVAFTTGFRKSDYDIFEINFKVPAGGIKTN